MSKQAEQYFADHASSASEVERLGRICQIYDGWTQECLAATDLTAGMHVAEIGFGTGSMLAWLARQVGDSGVAHGFDLTPRFVKDDLLDQETNIELFEHNIQTHDLPSLQYQLIYTRLVLAHLFEPVKAIKHAKNGLKLGGKFVALDYDSLVVAAECDHPLAEGFNKAVDVMNEDIGSNGLISASYGAEMQGQFAEAGFKNIKSKIMERHYRGGDFGALLSADGVELLGQARPELAKHAQTIAKAMRTPGFTYRDTDMYCCIGEN